MLRRTRCLTGASVGLLRVLLGVLTAGCGVVLGVPSDTRDVEEIALKICNCPKVADQPADVGDACLAAKEDANESDFIELAEAECDSCKNLPHCYRALTGAGKVGDPCSRSSECGSFACCVGGKSEGPIPALLGECCDSCFGCVEASEGSAVDPAIGACVESFRLALQVNECLGEPGCPETACLADLGRPL